MDEQHRISEIFDLRLQDGYAILQNIITKERIKITHKSAQIIRYIRDQCKTSISFAELQQTYYEFDRNELENFYQFLIAKRILVEVGEDAKVLIAKPVYGLFQHEINDYSIIEDSVVYLGIPFGKGNTVDTGTFLYPDRVRFFTNKFGIRNNIVGNNVQIFDVGDIFFYDREHTFISYSKIKQVVGKLSHRNNKIFSLGGDHSVSFPIIEGLSKKHGKMNVIHFDAHTDCYRSPIHDLHENSGYCCHHHGNFLGKAVNQDYVIGVYQYGLRSLQEEQEHLSKKIKSYKVKDLKLFLESVGNAERGAPMYVTFDIDIIDPVFAPGTATPVINGVEPDEILEIIKEIERMRLNVVGIDLVEINPNKDVGDVTMQLSIEIIKQLSKLLL